MIRVDEKFSYSKLEKYCNCPFSYYLHYVLGYNEFVSNIACEVGTTIHMSNEDIATLLKDNKEINYQEEIKKVVDSIKEIHNKYPTDFEAPDKTGKTYAEKINYYLNNSIFSLEKYMNEHPTYEIVGIEQDFDFIYKDKYRFHGFIDRVFKDTKTGKYIIQDIKTYAEPLKDDKLRTPLQFVVYCLAAKELYKCDFKDIECEYYMPFLPDTNSAGLTQKAGTDGFIERGLKKLDDIFAKIEKNEFQCKQSPLCYFCSYCVNNPNAPEKTKLMCPYFMHWTRTNKIFSKENEWMGLEYHQAILENFQKKYIKKTQNN